MLHVCTMLEWTNISAAWLDVCWSCHAVCSILLHDSMDLVCPAMLLQGSVDYTTCEYQRLIDQAPHTIIPARPFTVHDRVYDAGDPLGGNFCPFNSSTPLQPCKKVPPCRPHPSLQAVRTLYFLQVLYFFLVLRVSSFGVLAATHTLHSCFMYLPA